jgi:hypothetical protein
MNYSLQFISDNFMPPWQQQQWEAIAMDESNGSIAEEFIRAVKRQGFSDSYVRKAASVARKFCGYMAEKGCSGCPPGVRDGFLEQHAAKLSANGLKMYSGVVGRLGDFIDGVEHKGNARGKAPKCPASFKPDLEAFLDSLKLEGLKGKTKKRTMTQPSKSSCSSKAAESARCAGCNRSTFTPPSTIPQTRADLLTLAGNS